VSAVPARLSSAAIRDKKNPPSADFALSALRPDYSHPELFFFHLVAYNCLVLGYSRIFPGFPASAVSLGKFLGPLFFKIIQAGQQQLVIERLPVLQDKRGVIVIETDIFRIRVFEAIAVIMGML
jgi:hypothetical protein